MKSYISDLSTLLKLPCVDINLMYDKVTGNDPFFERIVREFCAETRRLHPKFPVVTRLRFGVAICPLPATFNEYFMSLDGAARRNYKKGLREKCTFRRIQFNDQLDAIREIRQSAKIRQGKGVPAIFLQGTVDRCDDPASNSDIHDYPYFGVFIDGRLVAYASCLISGELCMIEHILGHAAFFEQCVVPFLIIEIGNYLYANHCCVKYFGYGTYFGGGTTFRRFKRKFGFAPHRVRWIRQLDSHSQ